MLHLFYVTCWRNFQSKTKTRIHIWVKIILSCTDSFRFQVWRRKIQKWSFLICSPTPNQNIKSRFIFQISWSHLCVNTLLVKVETPVWTLEGFGTKRWNLWKRDMHMEGNGLEVLGGGDGDWGPENSWGISGTFLRSFREISWKSPGGDSQKFPEVPNSPPHPDPIPTHSSLPLPLELQIRFSP